MKRSLLPLGWFFVLIGLGFLMGCQTGAPAAQKQKLKVVVSIPPLGDFARWVGGEWVEVTVLVDPGKSPHTFEPLPEHVKALAEADVILFNGRGLEPWASDLLASANPQARVVYIANEPIFQTAPYPGNAHLWLDVTWAKAYVSVIRQVFEEADPRAQPKSQFYGGAIEARQALDSLEGELRRMRDAIPKEKRRVAVAHAAWEPFLSPLDFYMVPLLEGAAYEGHTQEVPPKTMEEWMRLLTNENIKAIVVEIQNPIPTLTALSQDLGIPLAQLDPLGGMPGRETYADMMRYNMRTLVEALQEAR